MFASVVLLSVAALHTASAAFNCDVNAFDRAAGDIIFFGKGPTAATNASSLEESCKDQFKSLQYTQDYAENCVTGIAKGMIKLFLEGAALETNQHCVDEKVRKQYLELVPCLVSHGKAMHKCNRHLAGVLEASTAQAKKHRVPISCCSVGTYRSCVSKLAAKCSPGHARYTEQVINNYAEDLLTTVCSKFKPGSKECKALPRVTPVTTTKFHTFLPPLAEVLKSLNS